MDKWTRAELVWALDLARMYIKAQEEFVRLDKLTDEFVNKSSGGSWSATFNVMFLTEVIEESSGFFGLEFSIFWHFNSKSISEALHHGDSLKWLSEVDLDNVIRILGSIWIIIEFVFTIKICIAFVPIR